MTAIEITDLSFTYQTNLPPIFKKLTLTIRPPQFLLLTGPSGCGKSTLLKLIAGLLPKFAGHQLSGQIKTQKLKCAMMFQNPNEQFTMMTPRQELSFVLENSQCPPELAAKRLLESSHFAKIDALLDQPFAQLSGGEKQRVALAVLVAMAADVLLLDEPFASIDPPSRRFLIQQLGQLKAQGKTILIADHDLCGYEPLCDQLYHFQNHQLTALSSKAKKAAFDMAQKRQTPHHFKLPDPDQSKAFALKDVSLQQRHRLLSQETLAIYHAKITLLTGHNGSGKTTLFRALTKMTPYEGHLLYQNHELKKLKARTYLRQVAQIFQQPTDQFLMITVQEEIALSLKMRRNAYFTKAKVSEALTQLGLQAHLNQVVYTLSGGQQKKLQLLVMLMSGHEVLLIDEPLSGLDHNSCQQVVTLICESQQALQQTILIISHQVEDDLANGCDYHLRLHHQKLAYVTN